MTQHAHVQCLLTRRHIYVFFECDQRKSTVVFLVFFTEIVRLFVSGSVLQGHEIVAQESRGRQCAFIALSSILYEQNIRTWSATCQLFAVNVYNQSI